MNRKIINATICIIIGIIIIIIGMQLGKNINPIYNFTIQKNHDYKVVLKPNTFYETETLPSGGYYISNSINDYILDLKYEFEGDKKVNLEYNYNIIATLIGEVEDKQVWERNFILKENTNYKQENTDKTIINEKPTIDFDFYKRLADEYEKAYSVSINAVLKVRLNVTHSINSENIDDYIEIDIPINDTVSEVRQNYENTTTRSINSKIKNFDLLRNIIYIIGTTLIIISIILIILEIRKNKKEPEEIYKNNMKRILKYYKDLIVTVENKPDFEKLKIMKVSTIEDLIDVAEQTKNNIILYERPYISRFYVIVEKYVYVYKLIQYDKNK